MFKEEQQKKTAEINRILSEYLPKEEGFQGKIMEAMQYSVTAGGKRLRPMLLWEVYRMFGGMYEDVVAPFMVAIEMIHTYSLVHDDLPAMDNDTYRRGKLTTHAKYGEAMGVLTGDALLNYAQPEGITDDVQTWLDFMERYNGTGYSKYYGICSPYVYAGTSFYASGKYTSDGKFDPSVVDQQPGTVVLLTSLQLYSQGKSYEECFCG